MSRGRVLVVSDQPKALAELIPSLAGEGFEVMGSPPSPEILRGLQNGEWDIVLLNASPQNKADPMAESPPMIALVRPRGADGTIAILSGFDSKILSLSADPEVLNYILSEAQTLKQEAMRRVIAPLLKVGQILEKSEALVSSLEPALKELAQEIAADYGVILSWDGKRLSPIFTFSRRGESPTLTRDLNDLARPVAEEGRPLILLEGVSPDSQIEARIGGLGLTSAFLVPLQAGNQVSGVLGFLKFKGHFTQHDVDRISALSSTLALALEDSRLREEIKSRGLAVEEYEPLLEQRRREILGLNRLLHDQQQRLQGLDELHRSLRQRYVNLLRSLVAVMETGEPSGKGRSAVVAEWVVPLAEAMGMKTEGLAEAAYLHDVGEIGSLAQDLSLEEKEEQLKAHPLLAEKMAQEMGLPQEVCQAIRHHHENWDGSGYPEGLSGEKIPLGSRLLRVLDEWASLTVTEGFNEEAALAQLKAGMGKDFDPKVVETFSKLVKKAQPPPEVELVSTVSHELRSPLSSLVGYSELLTSLENLDPVAKKRAEEIHAEALRMDKMVQNLLDLSRLELGKLEPQLEEVELTQLAKRALEGVRVRAPNYKFLAQLPANLPRVQADPDLILQVLDNLLDNAVKYSPEGSQITLSARRVEGEIQVSISDPGIGIPKDKLKDVFKKFYRVDSPLKGKVSGAGLGLSLCQLILEAHGGRIWAESKEGQGSTFHFTLPLRRSKGAKR